MKITLTPLERLQHYYEMLKRIYGEKLNAPLPKDALKAKY
jgi:hypothetical protein